jgi:RNA recognition motif-containing protein
MYFLGRGGGGGGSGGGGGGSYGFRRQNDGEVEILSDAIFIQNLPKNITRDEILAAFSTVGNIKVN